VRTRSRLLRLLVVALPVAALTASLVGPLAEGRPSSAAGADDGGALAAPVAKAAEVDPGPSVAPLGPAAAAARVDEPVLPRPLPSLTGYVWPLPHGRITQPFGPSRGNSFVVDGVEMHDGVDLATFCGDHVVAAHDGVVVAAGRDYQSAVGWRGDLGPYLHWLDTHAGWADLPITVVIDDEDTYSTVYAHFSRIVVSVGQHVRAGQLLGYEGRTGHATGCHLHFGLFSPLEPATWPLRPDLMAKYSLPPAETAHVDPLLVLPTRSKVRQVETPLARLPR
jgi:murein DD-endopeptidase MepM/ murein hydrolase activator NlpD